MGPLPSQRAYLLSGALLMVIGVSAAELVGLKQGKKMKCFKGSPLQACV